MLSCRRLDRAVPAWGHGETGPRTTPLPESQPQTGVRQTHWVRPIRPSGPPSGTRHQLPGHIGSPICETLITRGTSQSITYTWMFNIMTCLFLDAWKERKQPCGTHQPGAKIFLMHMSTLCMHHASIRTHYQCIHSVSECDTMFYSQLVLACHVIICRWLTLLEAVWSV